MGAGIEITMPGDITTTSCVAPLVGARIEIYTVPTGIGTTTTSLPSWERGLKFLCPAPRRRLPGVAPLVGARIEIVHPCHTYRSDQVAPLVGARIEIMKYRQGCKSCIVAPLVGARIEIPLQY